MATETNLPSSPPAEPLRHIDSAGDALARRLIALMATAKGNGASEQEMETALMAAQRLAIANRIDLSTISLEGAGVSAPEEMVEDGLRVGRGKRKPPANRFICSILLDFFNVEIVTTSDCDDAEYQKELGLYITGKSERFKNEVPSPPTVLSFLGRKSDVLFAKYAYGFLQGAFSRAWREHKQANNSPMSERASFYLGVWRGLSGKLRRAKRETEAELLALAPVEASASYALATVKEEDVRGSFLKDKHPVLTYSKAQPVNVTNRDTVWAGVQAGEKIEIHKALSSKTSVPEPAAPAALS